LKKIIVALAILAMFIAGYIGFDVYKKYKVESEIKEQQEAKLKRKEQIDRLLKEAKIKTDQAVTKRALEFKAFIDSKKPGAKPFSEDVVSLSGIWIAGKCKMPGTAPNCYKEYISDKFNKHIFTPDDFRDATTRSIKGGVQDIDGIENQLAVSLREVIEGRTLTASEQPLEVASFKSAIESARRAASDGVAKEVGGLVAAEAITQIGTQVLIRLGVPLVILTTASSTSWWTLGVSVLIGLIFNSIWNYFTHPAQTVEKAIVVELDKMAESGSAVIQEELTKKVAARSQLWQTIVSEKLQ
jgi:hypothetical protein